MKNISPPLQFSAWLAYNWRCDDGLSFISSGDQPEQVHQWGEKWMDVAFNYELNKQLRLFAEVTNLLGTTTSNYFGQRGGNFPRGIVLPERTYTRNSVSICDARYSKLYAALASGSPAQR